MIVNNLVIEPDFVDRIWHEHEKRILATKDRWERARMESMTKEQVVRAEVSVIIDMFMKGEIK